MHSDDVLLVDADPCALGLMAQGLTRQGLQVRSVARSEDAIASLSENPPSLVISDVEPSGADGLRILEVMRRDPRTAAIPVLLLAKGEWTRRQEEAKQLGAQGLLKKPLFVQDVAVLGKLHAGHAAAEETFTGELGDVRCGWLVRGLLAGGRSGQISFDPAGGRIYFRDGCVIDAVLPPLGGERALWRMLTFERGRYRIRFGEVDRPQTLAIDVRDLQARGFEHVRRWNEIKDALGALDAKLEVDYRRLSEQLDAVPPAVWPLLRLFDGHRTLGQALDGFGVDDHVGAQAVVKLHALGLLRAAGTVRPAETAAPPAPLALTEIVPPAVEYQAPVAAALPADAAAPVPAQDEPVAALVFPVPEDSSARRTDAAIESFFFGEEARPETLEAAAAAEAALAEAPQLAHLMPALAPEGVALALGFEETETPVVSTPVAEQDAFESSFFGTADAIEAPAHAAMSPEAGPGRSRWMIGGLAAAGVAALAIAFWPRNEPAPRPVRTPPPAPVVALPPARPAPIPAVVAPPPAAPAPSAEIDRLLAEGQKSYDAHDYAKAEATFQKAVALVPGRAVAQMYLGLVEYEQGKLAEAVAPLEKARELDPKNLRTDVLLGADYQELGKMDLSRERYEAYLEAAPRGDYAAEVREVLARMAPPKG